MAAATHNLILVNRPLAQAPKDFNAIAARMAALAPEIAVHLVHADTEAATLPVSLWEKPVLAVSMLPPGRFRPLRGRFLHGAHIPKFEQMRRFADAGVAVPVTALYAPGRQLRPERWGRHVIVKPTAIRAMSNGDAVFLMRTERAAELSLRVFPEGHAARAAPLLVQQFIDTGDYPESYRVLTLFGAPIHAMRYRAWYPRPPLDAPDEKLLEGPVASNADPHFSCMLDAAPEVLAFARRAAAAMPEVPLQGLDIIRERTTGRLYALEANPGGNTWHFSSKLAEQGRREVSGAERIAQFGAWDVAARVLAERTLSDAV